VRERSRGTEDNRRGGVSHLSLGDGAGLELELTWTEVPAGSAEQMRACDEDRAYMVVRGSARMAVDEERVAANEWDILHVPAGFRHAFENASAQERLVYVILGRVNVGTETL
jgi:mannose-6-phosphate isomerase-like protein (cupin superfamily)